MREAVITRYRDPQFIDFPTPYPTPEEFVRYILDDGMNGMSQYLGEIEIVLIDGDTLSNSVLFNLGSANSLLGSMKKIALFTI